MEMNTTEEQNPRHKLDDKCLWLSYVFSSVLACAKSAHVFQKLSHSLRRHCLSLFSLATCPQTVKLFYVSLHSQAPQQQYTVHCMHYSITLWACLSEPLVKDGCKHLSSTEKPQYHMFKSFDHTLPLHTCYREVYYTKTLHVKKMTHLVKVREQPQRVEEDSKGLKVQVASFRAELASLTVQVKLLTADVETQS